MQRARSGGQQGSLRSHPQDAIALHDLSHWSRVQARDTSVLAESPTPRGENFEYACTFKHIDGVALNEGEALAATNRNVARDVKTSIEWKEILNYIYLSNYDDKLYAITSDIGLTGQT